MKFFFSTPAVRVHRGATALLVVGAAAFLAGCETNNATTSRFGFSDPSGASGYVEFPKELEATKFSATMRRDGTFSVKADFIVTRNVETVRAQGEREKKNLKAAGDLAGKLTESAVRGAVKGVAP